MRGKKTLALLTIVLLGTLSAVACVTTQSQEQTTNKALVVVRLSDDRTEVRCVEFEETQITGLELLDRSGLVVDLQVEGMGAIACEIEGTGCPASDCFCNCRGGGPCTYWSYWHLEEEGWRYSQLGASAYQVGNGSIDGWSWGPGSLVDAVEPPEVVLEDHCAVSTNVEQGAAVKSQPAPIVRPTGLGKIAAEFFSSGPAAMIRSQGSRK